LEMNFAVGIYALADDYAGLEQACPLKENPSSPESLQNFCLCTFLSIFCCFQR